jgi:hypothetical protein
VLLSRRAVICAAVGVAIFGFTAQLRARLRGLQVRFVGTFQPFDKKAAGNLHTLTVSYKKHQWLFHVERVNVMGARDPGTMFLSRIAPPRLSFVGPPRLVEPLGSPENVGKRFTLEGLLYLPHRSFHVSTVREETTPGPEKQEEEQREEGTAPGGQ